MHMLQLAAGKPIALVRLSSTFSFFFSFFAHHLSKKFKKDGCIWEAVPFMPACLSLHDREPYPEAAAGSRQLAAGNPIATILRDLKQLMRMMSSGC